MQLPTPQDPWRRRTRVRLPSRHHTPQPLQCQRLSCRRRRAIRACLFPWRWILRQDWKKFSTCAASKQFIVPCPRHVLDALIWKTIVLEQRKSFRSLFFILQASGSRLVYSRYFFYDGMFCVGIAAARMHRFNGSLYNFASATHGFLRHYTFQASQWNLVRRTIVHKTFDSSSSQMLRLWFLGCSPWDYWDSWKAALQLLLASALLAFKTSKKSLSSSGRTMILKKTCFCQQFILSLDHLRRVWFHSYSAYAQF